MNPISIARVSSISLTLALLTGCRGSSSALTPSAPASSNHAPLAPVAGVKQFGVNLANDAGAESTKAGGSWTFDYCNGGPGNPSQCYDDVPGRRVFADNASGTAYLYNGSQSVGYTKAKIGTKQQLGIASYTMSAETNAIENLGHGYFAQSQIVSAGWNDTLYISSGSLKKGSPVTIGVKWTLTAHTNVACDSAKNSYGELYLYSASVTPPSGQFSITGACSNGSFGYYLYNNPKQPGTTAVGTINTAVGDSYPIYFTFSGQVIACTATKQCIGDYFATLSGKYAFTITSITPGATYTTASGNTYQ
ncbi:MAG: hypothetical protein JO113_03900 [Candidatus Eremiobacteraeota bacterium]|nr:hypothetical protein [Candidatus Eremiobacteraeota bacterium]